MFPGYVSIFKDKNRCVHLYFFPGITDNGEDYYNRLKLENCKCNYIENCNQDGSIEFIFDTNTIKKINCKLIRKYDNIEDIKVLTL